MIYIVTIMKRKGDFEHQSKKIAKVTRKREGCPLVEPSAKRVRYNFAKPAKPAYPSYFAEYKAEPYTAAYYTDPDQPTLLDFFHSTY